MRRERRQEVDGAGEGLAIHTDPESCAGIREGAREALTGARAGGVLFSQGPMPSWHAEGNTVRPTIART
jgi:hypothetical protein